MTLLVVIPVTELLITWFAPNGRNALHATEDFPWVKELEDNWMVMAEELDGVLHLNAEDCLPSMADFLFYRSKMTQTLKNWKVYPFYFFGHRFETNRARCPKTVELISRVPNMTGAMFSILNGHQRIYPHRGFIKGVIRLHVGLKVPKPEESCTFSIAGKTIHWREGGSFMFDQVYQHEAWNDSDDVRVVLLLDVLRPLPPWLHRLNTWTARLAGTSFIGQKMADVVERWSTRAPVARRS